MVHAESLEKYLRLARHLIPTSPELTRPVLRHPDIQPNNIFISDDCRVTSLIDWQHAVTLPTFLAAGIPNSFQNYGDAESRSFTPPRLPMDLNSLDEFERSQACEQFRRRHVHFFYLGFTQKFNLPHWRALEEETDLIRRRIFDHAGEPWEGLNTSLLYDLSEVSRSWNKIAPLDNDGTAPTCPVSFTHEEAEQIDALDDLHRTQTGMSNRSTSFLVSRLMAGPRTDGLRARRANQLRSGKKRLLLQTITLGYGRCLSDTGRLTTMMRMNEKQ
jgi:hypothetical protein